MKNQRSKPGNKTRVLACLERVNDIDVGTELLEEHRYVFRPVLEISVHQDDPVTQCSVEAGCDGRVLPEIAAQLDSLDPRIRRGEFLYKFPGSVTAPVVHQQQFEIRVTCVQGILQP